MEKKREGRDCEGNENTIESGYGTGYFLFVLFSAPFPFVFSLFLLVVVSIYTHARYTQRPTFRYRMSSVKNVWSDFRAVRRRTNVAMAHLKLVFAPSLRIKLYRVTKKIFRDKTQSLNVQFDAFYGPFSRMLISNLIQQTMSQLLLLCR